MSDSDFKKLKVAVVADVLTSRGGAEVVVESLLDIFSNADVFTSIDEGNPRLKMIRNKLVRNWDKPWFIPKKYSFFAKLFINSYWESLDFKDYDLVISSTDEYSSKSVITNPGTLHISYCHTPPRYLYPEYSSWDTNKVAVLTKRKIFLSALRIADYVSAQRPDVLVTNSHVVQRRIKKYYHRNAVVINPPVAIPKKFSSNEKRSNYYLYVGSLDKRKGVDLAIKAFNKINSRLVIIGSGNEISNLKSLANKNIRFLGYATDKVKQDYLRKAKGFIFPSIEEDFGIAPVEAMAWGAPVFAYKSGGLLETVKDGITGSFFETFNEETFIESFKRFEKMKFDAKKIHKHALKYSSDTFKKKFIGLVKKELNNDGT